MVFISSLYYPVYLEFNRYGGKNSTSTNLSPFKVIWPRYDYSTATMTIVIVIDVFCMITLIPQHSTIEQERRSAFLIFLPADA
ncbi:MAG: hypothetical protein WBE34_07705 [Candidatus Nitrosopolaris sp.]